jgi:hypothetical protein
MRFSNRRWMKYGAEQQNADAKARAIAVVVALFFCLLAALALAGCGTTALKPEPKLVSSVTSLPPVEVPIPVRCIDKVPPIPDIKIDPNATVLQRHYMSKEVILAYEGYIIETRGLLLGCAAKEPK